MGSKFLSGGDGETDLSVLKNGSFEAYLGTLEVDSLTPNDLVRADADKKLVSTLVEETDLNFSVLTNPNPSNLVSDGVEVTAGNVLKTDTINSTTGTTITTNSKISVVGNEIETNNALIAERVVSSKLFGDNGTADIGVNNDLDLNPFGTKHNIKNVNEIDATTTKTDNLQTVDGTGTIQLNSSLLSTDRSFTTDTGTVSSFVGKFNNISSQTGTIDPIVSASSLDMGNNDITNTTNIEATISKTTSIDTTRVFNTSGTNVLFQDDIEMKTKDILGVGNVNTTTLDAGNVNITGSTVSSTGVLEFKSGASDRVNFKSDNGILSIENATLGGPVELEFAQFGFETFSINKNSSRVDICQSGLNNIELTTDCFSGSDKKVIFDPVASGGTGNAQFRDYNMDMNSNNILDVGNLEVVSVNDLTSVGGIYSGISDGATISSSTFADLLPTASVGGLSVPADTFLVGSAFHLVCAGTFPSESKNDDVEIELCAIQGGSTIQLGIVRLDLENFDTSPSNFELEADFVIRSIGPSAQVAVSFDFTFNKRITKDFKGTRATNLATINTELASTLELNARIIGSSGSSIKSTLAYLRKQY